MLQQRDFPAARQAKDSAARTLCKINIPEAFEGNPFGNTAL